jgi:hypothetical protein
VNQLSLSANLDDLLAALKSAEVGLNNVSEVYRHHTFMVGAIVHGKSVVAMVSNFQSLNTSIDRAIPGSTLEISIRHPRRIRVFAAGSGSSTLQIQDRLELEALAQGGASQEQIQEKLKEINERIASRDKRVSRGCYVASRLGGGSGSSRPYLTTKQSGDFLPPEMSQKLKAMGINLEPAIDAHGNPQPIRVVGETFASLDMSAGYFKRELPKRPMDAELWSNYGVFLQNGHHVGEAEAAFRKAVMLDPGSVRARRNLAGLLGRKDTTISEALQIYEELLVEAGTPTEVRSDFAEALDRAGNLDRAETEHESAANKGDSVRVGVAPSAFTCTHTRVQDTRYRAV